MLHEACIRQEYKGRWEGRAPLTPAAVKNLVGRFPIRVERCAVRAYRDEAYAAAGATMVDGGGAAIVLGINEPPLDIIREGQIHLCFSHTFKGQPFNMKLLRTFMDRGCTLIDYETMRDESGKRVIAFGRYAGIAGAVDTFYVAGRKFAEKRGPGSLAHVEQTWRYGTLEKLKASLQNIKLGSSNPVRVVIVGTGNVGLGAAEVCRWMNFPEISPAQLEGEPPAGSWFCVMGTPDVVTSLDGSPYDKASYRTYGSKRYKSTFTRFLGKFDILLQTSYWEEKYPYQLPRELMLACKDTLPMTIGDISCDINGSLACTTRESTVDEPAYTYLPDTHEVIPSITWDGPTVMAIDHLPCELAQDASEHFSRILTDFLPEITAIDLEASLETCGLRPLLQNATIVFRGKLNPRYAYLEEALAAAGC